MWSSSQWIYAINKMLMLQSPCNKKTAFYNIVARVHGPLARTKSGQAFQGSLHYRSYVNNIYWWGSSKWTKTGRAAFGLSHKHDSLMSHIKKMIFTFYRFRAVLITQCVFSQYRIYKIKRRITRNNRTVPDRSRGRLRFLCCCHWYSGGIVLEIKHVLVIWSRIDFSTSFLDQNTGQMPLRDGMFLSGTWLKFQIFLDPVPEKNLPPRASLALSTLSESANWTNIFTIVSAIGSSDCFSWYITTLYRVLQWMCSFAERSRSQITRYTVPHREVRGIK